MTSSELIYEYIVTLKTKTFEELLCLADLQSEEVIVEDKKNALTIYKDQIKPSKIRIVVQIYNHVFLGMGTMNADGFIIESCGKITDLKNEELWDFT